MKNTIDTTSYVAQLAIKYGKSLQDPSVIALNKKVNSLKRKGVPISEISRIALTHADLVWNKNNNQVSFM